MDEGTLQTPIPKYRLYWSFLCGRWCSNLVGSESGQKQSVKLLQTMFYNTTQHLPPPPHNHTCLFILYVYFGRGGGEVREKVEGHQYTSIVPSFVHGGNSLQDGSKIPIMSECISTLQSIKSIKQMPQNFLTGQFFRKADVCFFIL